MKFRTYISSTYILKKVYMFEYKIFWSFKREIFCSFQDRGIENPILVNFPYDLISTPLPKTEFYKLDPRLLYSVLFSPCVGFFLHLFTLVLAQTLLKMYTLSNWHSYFKIVLNLPSLKELKGQK